MAKHLEKFETEAALTAATPGAYPWVGAEIATKKVRYVKKQA